MSIKLGTETIVPSIKGILVENYENGTSGYRVYSDGWCEQWGKVTSGTSVTLLKSYSTENYNVTTGQHGVNTSTAGANYNWVTLYAGGVRDKTTSGFEVSGDNSFRAHYPIDWKTSGYIS